MGSHEGWVQPNGFYLNGLLPNEATSVTRVLDLNRWSIAEERIAELINCIQPNQPSEERRNAVAYYVQQLIAKCFSCEVFTFGSVPLKTYLPDGDIDLTAFSKNQNLKDAWANEVRDMLENEEKSEDAEFRVKEVQFIQAEVKIIKCLVENIVVDISFNQLGGLCTLCFLEEVDSLINQNHLFKRSIILIKAWCYYESRILGAHHGLISTYALETLVLYIFHVFNNSFAGPLEVLYRFLEFFSKFDWENFCVSLWGPVPISSLPDMTADPPRKDGRELLLSKVFLHACSSVYSVLPGGQENNELPFISKHFNVIDPLRTNNNLGRSVSKGNFFRIRSAFAFGAQRLARLLDCPKEKINAEVNQFFLNTLDRHGKGHRPDAPSRQLYGLQPINLNHVVRSDNLRNSSSSKQIKDNFVGRESELDMNHASHGVLSQNGNLPLKQMSRTNNVSAVSHTQSQKTYANLNGSVASYENHQMPPNCNGNTNAHFDKGRSCRPNYLGNEIYARYQFARTHSSPELTDTSTEISSQGKHYRASDTIEGQTAFARLDDSRRRNLGAEASDNNNARSSSEHLPPARRISSYQSIDAAVSSSSASNSYHGESGVSAMREDRTSVAETMQMHQEEQDFVNMMASSRFHSLSGHVQMPLNLASAHLPVPISPSILASMGYAHRNSAGVVPTSIASFEPPCGSNTHFPPNLVPVPVSQYTSSVGMASNRQKEIVEPIEDCFVSKETYQEDSDHGQWSKRDADSLGGFDPDNESFQARQVEKKDQFTSGGFTTVAASWVSSSESYSMKAHGSMKEDRQLIRKNYGDNPQHQSLRETNVNSASSRFLPASHATSSRSRPSSEGSWDGSSLRSSKSTRDRWGRKSSPSAERSTAYKNGWQYEGESVNHDSPLADDDNRDWIPLSTVDTEVAESMVPGTVASLLQSHQIPGYESAQMSGSTSMLPVAPVPVGSGSRRSMIDNNGVLPFTFYPTGPPVPFVTMLPFYSFPTEMETSDASAIHFDRDEEFNNSHISQSDQKSDSAENLDYPQTFSSNSVRVPVSVESSEEHKSDILNGDFASHWQSLQYGRLCQNPQNHGPLINQSPVVVPPMYIQGHFTWDGPGRPLSTNANLFTQLMGYGAGIIPVSPLQSGSNRPANVYQQFGDEIPRYRGGTGTYLPNPKISSRDRQSSNTRNNRGNYSFDRKDHHADREGNWNINSKQRFAGHGQGRNQVEKPNTRMDRSKASNGRSDRPWGSFKYDTSHSNRSRIGPFSPSTSTHSGSTNVAYGMYQLPVMNPNGVPPSGTTVPSVVMLYPYDQNMGCSSPAEQLEFGSLGPMHFSGINEGMQLGQGTSRGANEQLNFLVNSEHSSPDPPSSPKNQREL